MKKKQSKLKKNAPEKSKLKSLFIDKYNLRYSIPLCLIVLISLGFLGSGLIKKSFTPTITTTLNRSVETNINGENVSFKSATYYKKSNLLITSYYLESTSVIPSTSLEIKTYNGKSGSKIESTVEEINSNYYVVFTPNVSPDFKQIIDDITSINEQDEKSNIGAFAITQENIEVKNEKYETKPMQFYVDEYRGYAIQSISKVSQKLDAEIKELTERIEKYNSENKTLLESMTYKTVDQQEQIQQQIDGNNSGIEGLKTQIETIKEQQEKLKEQQQILQVNAKETTAT